MATRSWKVGEVTEKRGKRDAYSTVIDVNRAQHCSNLA